MKYIIPENWHYSNFGLHLITPKIHFGATQLNFKMTLDSGCWWKHPRNNDDYDINKIYGISYGYHHTNSLRLGWVPDFNSTNTIKIYGYWYQDKKRTTKFLCDVLTNVEYNVEFKIYEDNTDIYINNRQSVVDFHLPDQCKWGYYLFPYFGGNNKAPNNMIITILR